MKLELRDVALRRDGKTLLENLNLTILPGELIRIDGPSGSGKTSLLRLFNRLDEPAAGTVLIDGRPADEFDVTHLRRRIGCLQQTPVMVEGSVGDNINLPCRFSPEIPALTADAVHELLRDFLVEGVRFDDDAARLSVGQKQRIAFIRALRTQPEMLLCDEPTSALDAKSREIVEEKIRRAVAADGRTVVLVTHIAFDFGKLRPRAFAIDGSRTLCETPEPAEQDAARINPHSCCRNEEG